VLDGAVFSRVCRTAQSRRGVRTKAQKVGVQLAFNRTVEAGEENRQCNSGHCVGAAMAGRVMVTTHEYCSVLCRNRLQYYTR